MGDTPLGPPSSGGRPNSAYHNRQDLSHYSTGSPDDDGEPRNSQQGNSSHGAYTQSSHHSPQQNPQARAESFNMNHLGTALPDVSYQQSYSSQQARYPSAQSPTGQLFQQNHAPQFSGSPGIQSPANMTYNPQYNNQYQGPYVSTQTPSPPHLQPGSPAANQFYQNQIILAQQQQQHQHHQQQLHGAAYYIQQGHYNPQTQMIPGVMATAQYGARNNFSGGGRPQQQHANEYINSGSGGFGSIRSSISPGISQSNVVRGPPRKPRQSGHAIWIGNLPPQTELMNLVYHVCREVPGLESLFLISKSNCAFANFKDEATCVEAQVKIHDSRFQTVRLVSRLRRSSTVAATTASVQTSPADLTPPVNPPVARSPSPDHDSKAKEDEVTDVALENSNDGVTSNDKFFIVKSLTVEDLELSVRNGIWATQSHNEEALNKAYQTADNVYLIFSANKSGEYFGYARMISPINDDPAAAIEFAPKAQAVEDPELPKAIATAATEFAPKGRIIDDSARGTIFWEAVRGEDEEEEETDSNKSETGDSPPSKAWGKPFKIEWVSTTHLPFYKTRGLRNPWNSNREVKIARDGTELETSIGRRLLSLFHRIPSPVTQAPPHMQGIPVMMGGHPNMGAFY